MNDVLNDKAWLKKMMYIIRINQWDNSFGASNLFFGTSRMLPFYTARGVHMTNTYMPAPDGYVLYNKGYSPYGMKNNRGNLFANLNFKQSGTKYF